jgi:hypothetical protein
MRVFVDAAGVQVISAADERWIHPFTGLQLAQFRKLVRLVAKRGGDQIAVRRPGRQWALDLSDRNGASTTSTAASAPVSSTPWPG